MLEFEMCISYILSPKLLFPVFRNYNIKNTSVLYFEWRYDFPATNLPCPFQAFFWGSLSNLLLTHTPVPD
jgi:uncharacterized integral membrane protein